MPSLRFTLKGGKLKKDAALRGAFLRALGPAVQRGAMAVQAGVQKASPVKSGTLRRSWTTGQPQQSSDIIRVPIGTNVVYARRQDRDTRNRGYVRRGINASRSQAVAAVREGLKDVASGVWDRT